MALVDYDGSDSEDEDIVTEQKQKEETIVDEFDGETSEKPLELNKNDVLEDIVKRKDWEIKIAEKQKRKLEKKAAKKAAKKEAKKIAKVSKPNITKKIQIQAFGSLPNVEYSDSDEEAEPIKTATHVTSGFLSSLPAPKGKNNVLTTTTTISSKSLVPPSVAKKTAPVNFAPSNVPAPRFVDSDEDDDEAVGGDFFGFSSGGQNKVEEHYQDIPTSSSALDVVGPSKPSKNDYIHPSQMYNLVDADDDEIQEPQLKKGKISDEQAHKLLMRFSHDIGPEEKRSINEMANSIVDVNVDDAIGPDVNATILKNLGHRAFAEATSAPLPQAPPGGQVARRRNQITYLANMAVSREEALKEQWANQKQSKRMARQKYGF